MKRAFTVLFITVILLPSCKKNIETQLEVIFTNSPESSYTISSIEMADGGPASDGAWAYGKWESDILRPSQTIAAGESIHFILELPEGRQKVYRLGVLSESGQEIMLHEQASSGILPQIEHTRNNQRLVSVTVQLDEESGNIHIVSYADSPIVPE